MSFLRNFFLFTMVLLALAALILFIVWRFMEKPLYMEYLEKGVTEIETGLAATGIELDKLRNSGKL